MTAPSQLSRPSGRADFKRDFAKHAKSFANWTSRLPAVRSILVGSLAALLFTTIAGAFGTWTMTWATRLSFWALLIGFNAMAWIGWFSWRVKSPFDWWRAAIVGMIVLTLPLPIEILVALRLTGGVDATFAPQAWVHGLIVGAGLLLVSLAIHKLWPPPRPQPAFAKSLLFRHGVRDPATLASVVAEDHYCRLRFADGREALVHARFSDLAVELAAIDGIVLRRGVWVAAAAAGPIDRAGRRLSISMPDGRTLSASATGRKAMREAGWI